MRNTRRIAGLVLLILLTALVQWPQAKAITPQDQTISITNTHDDLFITETGIGIDSALCHITDPNMDIRSFLVFRELEINFWEPLENATLRFRTTSTLDFDADSSVTVYGMRYSDLQREGWLNPGWVLTVPFTSAYTNYNTSQFYGQTWHEVDVTDIVEELIRSYDWDGDGHAGTETGDAIGFIIVGAEGHDTRWFIDYLYGSPILAPQLVIHWNHEVPPPTDPPAPGPIFIEQYGNYTIWLINGTLDLSGFAYRKAHNITGSTAGAQTDYQMNITVYYGDGVDSGNEVYLDSKCRTDFGDIRFTTDDGSTIISHWNQTYNIGDNIIYWVEVDSIPADPDNATIYIYYGNEDATTTFSGNDTFVRFADFEVGVPGWFSGITGVQTPGLHANPALNDASYGALKDGTTNVADVLGWGFNATFPSSMNGTRILAHHYGEYYQYYWHQHTHYGKILYKDYFLLPTGSSYPIQTGWSFYLYPIEFASANNVSLGFHKDDTGVVSRNKPTIVVDNVGIAKYALPEPTHGSWGEKDEEGPDEYFVADANGTVIQDDLDSLDDAEDWIDIYDPDPEDPDPGGAWSEGPGGATGPLSRFRMRLYFLVIGMGCLFGPILFFASKRPSGYYILCGFIIMIIGIGLLMSIGQV